MAYDSARLRLDFPAWQEPICNLLNGVANEVISFAELERHIGSDDLSRFLNGYGVGVPITVLRDFLKRLKRLGLNKSDPCVTYDSLHVTAKRLKSSLWDHSVALGRILRTGSVFWESSPLQGIVYLRDYLLAVEKEKFRPEVFNFTNYGKYVLFKSLSIRMPWHQLTLDGNFDTLDQIVSAISLLPLDHLDRQLFPARTYSLDYVNSLRVDHERLLTTLANISHPQRRSDVVRRINWSNSDSPQDAWIAREAPKFALEVTQAPNGFWWLNPNL